MSAGETSDLKLLDILMALLPVITIVIALLAAVAVRVVSRSELARVPRDDPFFLPIAKTPIVNARLINARDFRAWGIPKSQSAGALRRNENGGRSPIPRSSAAVLTFRRAGKRHA